MRWIWVHGSWRWVRLIIVRWSSGVVRRTSVGIFTLVFTFRILLASVYGVCFAFVVFVLCACSSRWAHLALHAGARLHAAVSMHVLMRCISAVWRWGRVHLSRAIVRLARLVLDLGVRGWGGSWCCWYTSCHHTRIKRERLT